MYGILKVCFIAINISLGQLVVFQNKVLEENILEDVTEGWSTLQNVPCRVGIQEDDMCGACTTRKREQKLLLNFIQESIKERNLGVHVRINLKGF